MGSPPIARRLVASLGKKLYLIPMQREDLYQQMKDFLESEEACEKTLSQLNEKAQIGIIIGGTLHCCVQYIEGKVVVRKETCSTPDFIFHAKPDAVEVLIAEKGLLPGPLGIKLFTQLVTGQVTFSMPGNLLHILRKGYLDILKVGGKDFIAELKKHNLASPTKIINFLRKTKKNSK